MPGRAGAPHDVDLAQAAVLGRLIQLGAAGVGDGGVAQTVDLAHGVVARQVALGAARFEDVAGAPEVAEAGRGEELGVAAATGGAQKAVLARLVAHVDEVTCHGLCGLVPANALPIVAGLGAHALHGVLVAVGVVECLNAAQALGAHAPLGHGVDRVALDLDDAAVAHLCDDTAVGDARAARRADFRHVVVCPSLVAGDQVVCGAYAEGGCCAGHGCGADERASRNGRFCHAVPPSLMLPIAGSAGGAAHSARGGRRVWGWGRTRPGCYALCEARSGHAASASTPACVAHHAPRQTMTPHFSSRST